MSQTRPIDEHSMHTRTCGELRFENVGEEVTLTGWVSRRRDHGGLIFCDLRDREGITQLTFDPEHSDGDAFKIAETMRPEWPIKIHGVVRARGEETTNTKLATGEIEVLTDPAEQALIRLLAAFPAEIVAAADKYDPARITRYCIDVASAYHRFYNACRIMGTEGAVQQGRIALCLAVRGVIRNILTMFKVSVPETM